MQKQMLLLGRILFVLGILCVHTAQVSTPIKTSCWSKRTEFDCYMFFSFLYILGISDSTLTTITFRIPRGTSVSLQLVAQLLSSDLIH